MFFFGELLHVHCFTPAPCSHSPPPRTLISPSALADAPHLCSLLFRSTHLSSPPFQLCSLHGREQQGQLGMRVSKSGSGSGLEALASVPHHIPLFTLCYTLDAFFCTFPPPQPLFVLCPLPVLSLWARFVSCLFAPSSSPVPTAHKVFSSSPPLLLSFQKSPVPLLCSPLLLPLTSCSPLTRCRISAHVNEGANIIPTTTRRTFKCGLPATEAILLLQPTPSLHGWTATQTSTLTPWTFSWVIFQTNKWADLISPHSLSCQVHVGA